jgi:hypothetical protein
LRAFALRVPHNLQDRGLRERLARERLHKRVRNGTLTLRQAQKLKLAYKRKFG